MNETIYTQEPGKYHVQKTVGGYVVVFIEDEHTMRQVDGGKVYPSRQNAYAAAKRLNSNKTWLVQRVSYDGKEVWAEITVVAENWMAAKAAATRVFDYRDQRSGLMVAEHLIHGKNDHDGYIIPSAADAAKDWQRMIDEGLI